MDNILELLEISIAAAVFCCAVSLLCFQFYILSDFSNEVKNSIYPQHVLYEIKNSR